MSFKELDQEFKPSKLSGKKAVDGAITAAFASPPRNSTHRNASGHRENSLNDHRKMTQ